MTLMFYLLRIVLCGISMILTGLFALTIAGVSIVELINYDVLAQSNTNLFRYQWLIAILFLTVGFSIDLSKFVFWLSDKGKVYNSVSILLLVFSFLASTSFFITSEFEALKSIGQRSPHYQAIEREIFAIKKEIKANEQLIEKRLASAYHKQWQLAESTATKNGELSASLGKLVEKKRVAGEDYAKSQHEATRFFGAVAKLVKVDEAYVRMSFYGLLALLIEICALGSLRLKDDNHARSAETHNSVNRRSRILSLERDIREGKTPPKVRHIRELHYGLGTAAIKDVLDQLYDEGVLEDDAKESYRLKK